MKKTIFSLLLICDITLVNIAFAQTNTDWLLSEDGLGPIKIGMTVAQAEKATKKKFVLPKNLVSQEPLATASCRFATLKDSPTDVTFVFGTGIIYRIDTTNPKIKTAKGIHVGSSTDEAKILYKDTIKNFPNEYEPNSPPALLVAPKGSRNSLLFFSNGKNITYIRAGGDSAVKEGETCGMDAMMMTK
jgi:hypothetical protein